ncbi:MAG: rhodanese-like domain-containing protein [Gemmatimonadaceae bacterium]
MKTAAQLLAETTARVKQVSVQDVFDMQQRGERLTLLDVRDLQEVNLGMIPGAVHVSRGNLETKIEALIPRDAHVIVYCASGSRSAFAAETMSIMGYQNVASMAGGFRAWAEAGGDVD